MPLTAAHTIEICALMRKCDQPARFFGLDGASDFPCIYKFSSVWPDGKFGILGYGLNGVFASDATFPVDSGVTLSMAQSGVKEDGVLCYTNGFELVQYAIKSTFSTSGSTIYLGNNAGKTRGSDIVIHSFRIYDRVLSPEEIEYNARVDRARFFGGPVDGLTDAIVVSGVPAALGNPVPAYGTTPVDIGEEVDFSIADSLIEYPDGVSAVSSGDGVRAKLLGCTVTDGEAEPVFYEAASFKHEIVAKDTRAVWQFADSECLLSVPAADGVSYQVNGEAVGSEVNVWLSPGETVELTAVPAPGYIFRGWAGDTADLTNPKLTTITFEMNAPRALSVSVASAALDTVACYVTDGLLVHYDAIDNAGYGVHSADAAVWTDLSGNGVDGTINGTCVWKEKSLALDAYVNYDSCVTLALNAPAQHTVEVAARFTRDRSAYGRYCDGGSTLSGIYNQGGRLPDAASFGALGHWGGSGMHAGEDRGFRYCASNMTTLAISHSGLLADPIHSFLNGNAYGELAVKNLCSGLGLVCLGNSKVGGDRGADGDFYAFRVYDRVLTPAEIKWNNAVDRVRYGGVSTNEIYGKVEVFVENEPFGCDYGDVRYGGTDTVDVGEEIEFSIADKVLKRRFDGALVMGVVDNAFHDVYVGYEYVIDDPEQTSGSGTETSFKVTVNNEQMSPCLAIRVKWLFRREPIKEPGLMLLVR